MEMEQGSVRGRRRDDGEEKEGVSEEDEVKGGVKGGGREEGMMKD